jgi:flavodoxin
MHQVLFFSRGGKTRKLAEAIAGELCVKVADIKTAAIGPGDGIFFLGSGCYGGKPSKDMMKFIGKNDFTGRKVAIFGTSASRMGREVRGMEEALKQKGAKVLGSYHCGGQFLLILRRGHPKEEDLAGARKFGREMAMLG